MAYLQCLNNELRGVVYPIEEPACLLGRRADCHISDLFLQRNSVSRHHARIDRIGDHFLLTDLESHNGTQVNAQRVSRSIVLCPDDVISIGGFDFRFWPGDLREPESFSATEQARFYDDGLATSIDSRLDAMLVGPEIVTSDGSGNRLKALLGVLAALGNTLEPGEVQRSMLAALFGAFPDAFTGLIGLCESEDGSITPAAVLRRSGPTETVYLSEAISRHVVRTRQAILSKNAMQDPRLVGSASIATQGIRSAMCAPLLDATNNVLGIIYVDTRVSGEPFQEGDLQVLVAVAPLLSVVLQYSRLHTRQIAHQTAEAELAAAHRVQRSLLPESPPHLAGYEFFAYYHAAREVGGDYYDFSFLPSGCLAAVVADAAGKGVGAALYMASVSGELKALLGSGASPTVVVAALNRRLCQRQGEIAFVTLLLLVLDPRDHKLRVVNAGHEGPLCRQASGEVTIVGEGDRGLPLGICDDAEYQETQIELLPGDTLYAFTDGVTDAVNARQERFELRRVQDLVAKGGAEVGRAGQLIVQSVYDFVGRQPQFDDMCIVGLGRADGAARIRGAPGAAIALTGRSRR